MVPIYTLGQQKTLLIVGLGNLGTEYIDTRHNIGFACIDAFARSQGLDVWTNKKDLKSKIATGNIMDTRVILCKPTTFMNMSGMAVQAVSNFYKINLQHTVVIHDELDIDFGQIRTRTGGLDAGHNGVKSVIEQIGADFGRVRVGIGPKTPKQIDSADFVLAKFSNTEQPQLKNLFQESAAILTECIASGQLPHDTRNFLI